jgi:hypothetical protein
MGIFKRKTKERELPESISLPDLPDIPDFKQNNNIKMPVLPTISKEITEKSNREIMKSAINDNPEITRNNFEKKRPNQELRFDDSDFEIIKPQIRNPMTREISDNFSEYEPMIKIKQKENISHPAPQLKKQEEFSLKRKEITNQTNKQGPIFVRVDKYKSAVEKLQNIKQKIIEIEKLLSDVKELKSKEEFELGEWDKEIQSAKSKIDIVDKLLFSQLGD